MRRISIKAARIDVGLTQTQFGARVGVGKSTVASWESGRTKPTVDKIPSICAALDREYDEIQWNA